MNHFLCFKFLFRFYSNSNKWFGLAQSFLAPEWPHLVLTPLWIEQILFEKKRIAKLNSNTFKHKCGPRDKSRKPMRSLKNRIFSFKIFLSDQKNFELFKHAKIRFFLSLFHKHKFSIKLLGYDSYGMSYI